MRAYRRESFWRKHIELWRESGLIQAEYCREQNISAKTFSRWRIKLEPTARQVGLVKKSEADSALTLVPLVVSSIDEPGDQRISMRSPGGWQVSLSGITATELGELLGRLP